MTSFIAPALPFAYSSSNHCTCALEDHINSSDRLSSVDKQYLQKIRARLNNPHSRQTNSFEDHHATGSTEPDFSMTENLPEDLDDMEDILFDRAPENANHVQLFGAWLDDTLVGRKARQNLTPTNASLNGPADVEASVQAHKKPTITTEQAVEQSSALFGSALTCFNKGLYGQSTVLFAEAVALVGRASRVGGHYQLWHAQSLDAAGEKSRAADMLQQLRTHADLDIRKVSRELYYIITAPALELNPGSFIDIPSLDDQPPPNSAILLISNFGPLRTARMNKSPEPHSLEWYAEKKRPPKVSDNSTMEALLVTGALCCTLAYMFSSS